MPGFGLAFVFFQRIVIFNFVGFAQSGLYLFTRHSKFEGAQSAAQFNVFGYHNIGVVDVSILFCVFVSFLLVFSLIRAVLGGRPGWGLSLFVFWVGARPVAAIQRTCRWPAACYVLESDAPVRAVPVLLQH